MICSFFTFESSLEFEVGVCGSLGSVDVVGEEGSLMVRGGVVTTTAAAAAAAARGTNIGAVGRSDTALIADSLDVTGAATTVGAVTTAGAATAEGAAGGNAVHVGGLQCLEALTGAIVRPVLVLRSVKIMEGIYQSYLDPLKSFACCDAPRLSFQAGTLSCYRSNRVRGSSLVWTLLQPLRLPEWKLLGSLRQTSMSPLTC